MKIFLIGFMGCGKTYWGKKLSEKLKIPFFDLDEQIAVREDKSIVDIFAEDGEEYFRLLEKDVLHLFTESHETFVMACGGGTACYFKNIDYLKSHGTVVWINCSVECLQSRLSKEKDSRPLIRSLTDEQLKSYVIKKFADRKIYYQQASIILNEEEITENTLINRIFHN